MKSSNKISKSETEKKDNNDTFQKTAFVNYNGSGMGGERTGSLAENTQWSTGQAAERARCPALQWNSLCNEESSWAALTELGSPPQRASV